MQTIAGDAAGTRLLRLGPGSVLLLVVALVGLQLMLLEGLLTSSHQAAPPSGSVRIEHGSDYAYTLPYRVAPIRATSEPAAMHAESPQIDVES